jgi:hypothetical protein
MSKETIEMEILAYLSSILDAPHAVAFAESGAGIESHGVVVRHGGTS